MGEISGGLSAQLSAQNFRGDKILFRHTNMAHMATDTLPQLIPVFPIAPQALKSHLQMPPEEIVFFIRGDHELEVVSCNMFGYR